MMVSTRGRYALRVMVDLAQHNSGEYIPLRHIAERQDISEKYLEIIISSLSRSGCVVGLRGKGGGYRLAKDPSEYTVASILLAAEGSLAPVSCLNSSANECPRAQDCVTLPLWEGLYRQTMAYFEGITLEALIHGTF